MRYDKWSRIVCDCCGARYRFADIMTERHYCVACFRAQLAKTDLDRLAAIDAALALANGEG